MNHFNYCHIHSIIPLPLLRSLYFTCMPKGFPGKSNYEYDGFLVFSPRYLRTYSVVYCIVVYHWTGLGKGKLLWGGKKSLGLDGMQENREESFGNEIQPNKLLLREVDLLSKVTQLISGGIQIFFRSPFSKALLFSV